MANLANASGNDNDLHGDQNAQHWAERFAYYFNVSRKDNGPELDVHGLMLAWFAGAIETGRMYRTGGDMPDLKLIETAKREVFEYALKRLDKTDDLAGFTIENVYVVWFCKTLQNWKCLVSTDLLDGTYYEVTYDGVTETMFLDVYKKFDNVEIVRSDPDLAEIERLRGEFTSRPYTAVERTT